MKNILDTSQLISSTCVVLDNTTGNDYSPEEVEAQLKAVAGWQLKNGFIERQYGFKDYHGTLAFVNTLATMIHAQDHHPELIVTYNKCLVRFNTHSVNGISVNDFICAAKTDTLYTTSTTVHTL
jgi:4a-hydroxytetrahydrobiopterin dehydratase